LRILSYTDLWILSEELFWHRDLGLLTKAFRNLGHDAWLVVHPASESASKIQNPKSKISNNPVIWASPSDVRNPSWWQSQKPDLIILGLWTRPKYDSVRRAALSATARVIERADSDGMRTASCGFATYAKRRYDYFRDRTTGWPGCFSCPAAALVSLASILATPWIEARLAKTLKLLPATLVETPRATSLLRGLARRLKADPRRIHCIPHPVQTRWFHPDPSVLKKNQVISVGRWDSYQKNLPLLLQSLIRFLEKNCDWQALVVGSGLPPSAPHPRILFSPPRPLGELARHMQESRVFLSSSRYESFGLAAAEAAASGLRVVSTALPWGSPCQSPNAKSLAAALEEAARAGAESAGDPLMRDDFTPEKVAEKILGLFTSPGTTLPVRAREA